jgi:LacI family transcriptional regulator
VVRIKDVAALAGVSTATVSRVINGKSVTPRLRESVWRAVAELEYRPDRQARSLRRQRSDVIALVVPDIENPYFTSLARGVEDVTQGAGYSAVLCNTDEIPEKEEQYLEVVLDEKMSGVIIAAATPRPKLDDLLQDGRAVVAVDRVVEAAVDCVTVDNSSLGRQATSGLIGRGCRRIACITGPAATSTAADRAAGWQAEMRRHGLRTDGLLRTANFRVDGGRRHAAELVALDDPPDAILAANNLVGVGVLQALAQLPTARVLVSVIGELPFATAPQATVATLPLNPRGMGERAAQMLLERISGLDDPARHVLHA